MKPSIPDAGMVIRLEGENAVIRMKSDGSCGKCGVSALGLCRGGLMQVLTVKNTKRARVGDNVKIGLVQWVQYTGYLLAYVIPSAAQVFGIVGGHFLGTYVNFPPLDIIAGFASLIVVSYFSLRQLKRIDASSSIEIVKVLYDPWNPESLRSDEEVNPGNFMLTVKLIEAISYQHLRPGLLF
jgi:sigma-E factor negative regulatory protein RseC